jgi:Na+/H+-dicarboxylate symporter
MLKLKLHWQILIALVLAVVAGSLAGTRAGMFGLILAVDRVLDMCRTSVNVFSDSCGAVIIVRRTGENGVLGQLSLISV